jgi:hypothetical protein
VGIVFALVGNWSTRTVADGKWYFAPALLNAVMIRLGVTDWMAATYVGGVLYLLLTIVVISVLANVIGRKEGRQLAKSGRFHRSGLLHQTDVQSPP